MPLDSDTLDLTDATTDLVQPEAQEDAQSVQYAQALAPTPTAPKVTWDQISNSDAYKALPSDDRANLLGNYVNETRDYLHSLVGADGNAIDEQLRGFTNGIVKSWQQGPEAPPADKGLAHQILNSGRVVSSEIEKSALESVAGFLRLSRPEAFRRISDSQISDIDRQLSADDLPQEERTRLEGIKDKLQPDSDFSKMRVSEQARVDALENQARKTDSRMSVDPKLEDTGGAKTARFLADTGIALGEGMVPGIGAPLMMVQDASRRYQQTLEQTGDEDKAHEALNHSLASNMVFMGQAHGITSALDRALVRTGESSAMKKVLVKIAGGSAANVLTSQGIKAAEGGSFNDLSGQDAAQAVAFAVLGSKPMEAIRETAKSYALDKAEAARLAEQGMPRASQAAAEAAEEGLKNGTKLAQETFEKQTKENAPTTVIAPEGSKAPEANGESPHVISTAVNQDGKVLVGPDYNTAHDGIGTLHDMDEVPQDQRGFLVQDGNGKLRFASREEAGKIAKQADQVIPGEDSKTLQSDSFKQFEPELVSPDKGSIAGGLKPAYKTGDQTFVSDGPMHADALDKAHEAGADLENGTMGFVDSEGNFFDRKQAHEKVQEAKAAKAAEDAQALLETHTVAHDRAVGALAHPDTAKLLESEGVKVVRVDSKAPADGSLQEEGGGLSYNHETNSVEVDGRQLAATLDKLGDKGDEWLQKAGFQEAIHAADHGVAKAAGQTFQQRYDGLTVPDKLMKFARGAYGDVAFNKLESWKQKAEATRMVLEGRYKGGITEQVYSFIKETLARVQGFVKKASPEFKQHLDEVHARIEKAFADGDEAAKATNNLARSNTDAVEPEMPIKRAAMRMADEEVFEGDTHAEAMEKALDAGYSNSDLDKATKGFVDEGDDFLDSKAALERATRLRQVGKRYEGQLRLHGFAKDFGQLEAASFRASSDAALNPSAKEESEPAETTPPIKDSEIAWEKSLHEGVNEALKAKGVDPKDVGWTRDQASKMSAIIRKFNTGVGETRAEVVDAQRNQITDDLLRNVEETGDPLTALNSADKEVDYAPSLKVRRAAGNLNDKLSKFQSGEAADLAKENAAAPITKSDASERAVADVASAKERAFADFGKETFGDATPEQVTKAAEIVFDNIGAATTGKAFGFAKKSGVKEGGPVDLLTKDPAFQKAVQEKIFGRIRDEIKSAYDKSVLEETEAGSNDWTQSTLPSLESTPHADESTALYSGLPLGDQSLGIVPPGMATVHTGAQFFQQALTNTINGLKSVAKFTDFRRAVLNWSARNQASTGEVFRIAKELKASVPDDVRREALTNFIQAGGDMALLQQRATASTNGRLKKGYETALRLTPAEIGLAAKIRGTYDALLKRAKAAGIEINELDDYVNQIWKKNPIKDFVASSNRSLSDSIRFAKKRYYDSFFDGEQNGLKPETKDIAKLLPIYVNEVNNAIGTKMFIAEMAKGKASDGRPLLASTGYVKQVVSPEGEKSTFVLPEMKPDDAKDYKAIGGHPALHDWQWRANETLGEPIFVKGDLVIHPEALHHLENVLGQSAIRRWYSSPNETPLGGLPKLAVKLLLDDVQQIGKATMLGFVSPFHQVQEATHALGHRVNPLYNIPKIDLSDPAQLDAASHGLMLLPDRVSAQLFREGLDGSSRNLVSNAIGMFGGKVGKRIKGWADGYQNYLFHDYIPGLKLKTYDHILERNTDRYSKDIASGNISLDQVKYLSSQQTNAAYGHLNYADIGRDPTIQHLMQVFLLAPDFLEARGKFTAQAAKSVFGKHGFEQLSAIATLGALQYTFARILNKTLDDDYHWDSPFDVIVGGRKFTMRSVPEDIYKAFEDPRKFVDGRLSPLIGRGALELGTGRNYRGEPTTAGETIKGLLAGMIPLTLQPIPAIRNLTKSSENNPINPIEQLAGSIGLHISRYSPASKVYGLAADWIKAHGEEHGIDKRTAVFPISKYQRLRYALEDNDPAKAQAAIDRLQKGGMKMHQIKTGFHDSMAKAFTGNHKTDRIFKKSLAPEDQHLFDAAIMRRKELVRRFNRLPRAKPQ